MEARREAALKFPALPEYVREVRAALENFLRQAGVQSEIISDMTAAVSEACANVVRYAYADNSGDMEIKFVLDMRGVAVTVSDRGRGFDPENPPRRPIKDTDIHLGMGLQLMRGLVDEMSVRSGAGGTTVALLKKGTWHC